MDYNTSLPNLKIADYGRMIQQMVERCKTLPTREQRQAYAEEIVRLMRRVVANRSAEIVVEPEADKAKRRKRAPERPDSEFAGYSRCSATPEQDKTLWDHLAILADFELDIDFPEGTQMGTVRLQPAPVPYSATRIRNRSVGHLREAVEEMARQEQ